MLTLIPKEAIKDDKTKLNIKLKVFCKKVVHVIIQIKEYYLIRFFFIENNQVLLKQR